MTQTGILIAFEGMDQSGKETQARRLRAWFEARGRSVESLDFPYYDTPIGQEIWKGLHGERDYGADTIQLLYIANRHEFKPRMLEWLAAGRVVICDRYTASSVAYGEAQGLDPEWLFDAQRYLPPPALTVMIDIAPSTAVGRKQANRDRFEQDLQMLERVRVSYRRQAAGPGWVAIDGERAIGEVAADVTRAASTVLAPR